MASQEKKKILQLLSSLYSLDKFYATEIIVGLEYSNFRDEYYKPVVRLLGDDFEGITFTYDAWLQFTDCFNDFHKYLCGRGEDMMGQQICGSGWTVKFTRSQKDRAIEIEDYVPSTTLGIVTKRYRSTIIMKKDIFICLNEYIAKCIDARLEYLKFVAGSASYVARETLEYIKNFDLDNIPLLKCGMYTSTIVQAIINLIDDEWFDNITSAVQKRASELKDEISFSRNDIVDLFYQLASHHLDVIVDLLNEHSE